MQEKLLRTVGMEVVQMPDVQRVIFQSTSREIVVEGPEVSKLQMKGEEVFQVSGGEVKERSLVGGEIPEEDVQLVAGQAGVTLDKARNALEETGGDLAQAILLLTSKGE